jgi:hypothetical protein
MPVERKPIAAKTLAEHWSLSPSAVSKLKARKGMPVFFSLADADAWRSANMDTRGAAKKSDSRPVVTSPEVLPLEIPETEVARLEHAEKETYRLYMQKVAEGRGGEVAVALKNYTEASKQCAAAKERWLTEQAKRRELIDKSEAEIALGAVLAPLRAQIVKLARRYTGRDWSTPDENLRLISTEVINHVDAARALLNRQLQTPLEVADE